MILVPPQIVFSSAYGADKLIKNIEDDITKIFETADNQLNSITNDLILLTSQNISQQINSVVADILEKAKEKLKGNDDVEVNFNLPNINLTISDIDTSMLFEVDRHEKTKTIQNSRYKKSVWGWVCEKIGTKDWGKEDISYQEVTYSVDLERIRDQILSHLKNQERQLSNQTLDYLSAEFQPNIDKHLEELVHYLQRYSGVLGDGIKSHELDKVAKAELQKQLDKLSKGQSVLNDDIKVSLESIEALSQVTVSMAI
ncbi:MAG: hypothetical protein NTY50_00875 [Methylobacter sp.]|nr:hypothetical protein [Methylobacter sp.]